MTTKNVQTLNPAIEIHKSNLPKIKSENTTSFVQKRAEKRRKLAGSIPSVKNSDVDGAINHNDIYNLKVV
jgi:hypothetical protein